MARVGKEVGMDNCKLCNGKPIKVEPFGPVQNKYHVTCPKCGFYTITERAVNAEPDPFVKKQLHLISAVARWSKERGNELQVQSALLENRSEFEASILSVCPQNTQEILDRILAYIAEKASYPGEAIPIEGDSISPLFYCKNIEEVELYLKYLQTCNFVDIFGKIDAKHYNYKVALTVEGLKKVQEQAKPNIESKQAFVAMRFNDEMKSIYFEGIKKLEEDTGFTMHRVDMEPFNDKICDKIIAEIRRSRFVIADVTGHRQAVYFEAGFAKGLGLPVIWTCREDDINGCESNFDTRQYNHIYWTEANELREKLRYRIEATIGMAPK